MTPDRPRRSVRAPRLPWKRGPTAWFITRRASRIREALEASRFRFFSLRAAARILGFSTQPLRDWLRLGYLTRTGPRQQFSREELLRFLQWLEDRAQPYDSQNYLDRLPPAYPFRKLSRASFAWPKGRRSLKPSELAPLVKCHPSLIIKAIR